MHSPYLREGELFSISLRRQNRHKLFGILLFVYSIVYYISVVSPRNQIHFIKNDIRSQELSAERACCYLRPLSVDRARKYKQVVGACMCL